MTAYLDSSCVIAVEFGEAGATRLADRLNEFERLVSSNLLEAELRSALAREGRGDPVSPAAALISWIHPHRPLTSEFARILAAGRLTGADLWHLACALYFAPESGRLVFLTLDTRQRDVARKLGFAS